MVPDRAAAYTTSSAWSTVLLWGRMPVPNRMTNATRQSAALSSSWTVWPIQFSCTGSCSRATLPVGSRHDVAVPSGSSVRRNRSVVHGTVATVGMPNRSYTAARFES